MPDSIIPEAFCKSRYKRDLRHKCRQGSETGSTGAVSREGYESVRRLLQCPILLPPDAACDPLATDMVHRADVYLAAGSGEVRRCGSSLLGLECDIKDQDDRPPKVPMIRRECCLGNGRSGIVRRLVEYLHQAASGYEWYCRMGLSHAAPGRDDWQTDTSANLTVRPPGRLRRSRGASRLRAGRDGLRDSAKGTESKVAIDLSPPSFPHCQETVAAYEAVSKVTCISSSSERCSKQ